MGKSKEELLEELKKLGISESGRKKRTDAGKPREHYNRSDKPREDKGKPRVTYNKTALYYKNMFTSFIEVHSTQSGDSLSRDENLIFPPEITNYYKLCAPPGRMPYRASVRRPNHPESLRWRWWFAELEEATDRSRWSNTATCKTVWAKRICDWYFIKPIDLEAWTYDEWSWAYYTQIAGHENRMVLDKIILSYDDYLAGKYTMPTLDEEANIIWKGR